MWALISGGLRSAATTGYYLTALQAEIRSLGFHTVSVAPDPGVNLKDSMNSLELKSPDLDSSIRRHRARFCYLHTLSN